jgi:beta-lactamase superfamily II metal-dependent hydrolase
VAAESELAVTSDPSRIRILKVGHHGSRTSSSPVFVQAYHAAAALVSVGRGNPFGHPAADVLARLNRQGADVFRTDRDGAIIVETDGREIVIKTWSDRIWSARLAPPPS